MPQTEPGYTTAAEQSDVAETDVAEVDVADVDAADVADVVGRNSDKDVEVDVEGRQS